MQNKIVSLSSSYHLRTKKSRFKQDTFYAASSLHIPPKIIGHNSQEADLIDCNILFPLPSSLWLGSANWRHWQEVRGRSRENWVSVPLLGHVSVVLLSESHSSSRLAPFPRCTSHHILVTAPSSCPSDLGPGTVSYSYYSLIGALTPAHIPVFNTFIKRFYLCPLFPAETKTDKIYLQGQCINQD